MCNPKICYNCGEELDLDFIPMVVENENRDNQNLLEDIENFINPETHEEYDFEICKKCGAAQ